MWRNRETRRFVDRLHAHNAQAAQPVAFHGLDLYSLSTSIRAVLPRQFDEDVWFDETQAVTPLATADAEGFAETYPFGP